MLLVRGGLKRDFAYKTFHSLGVRLTVVERPFSPGVRFADRALVADLGDQGTVLERVLACHRTDPFDALLTFNDSALPLAAAIGECLGLPCLPAEVVSRSVNKDYMRDCLRPRGVAMPGYRLCREPADARRAADELGFPVVVKPVNRAASVAVSLARREDELAGAFLAARSACGRTSARRRAASARISTGWATSSPRLARCGRPRKQRTGRDMRCGSRSRT